MQVFLLNKSITTKIKTVFVLLLTMTCLFHPHSRYSDQVTEDKSDKMFETTKTDKGTVIEIL